MGVKRNRDPLAPNQKEKRVTSTKPKVNYYLERRAVEVTAEKIKNKIERARKCVAGQRKPIPVKPKTFANPAEPQEFEYLSHRSHAIAYLFIHIYGAPTEDNWYCERPSVVTEIMNTLNIPEGSSACVKRVLRDVLENGSRYDPKCHLCERGRRAYCLRHI